MAIRQGTSTMTTRSVPRNSASDMSVEEFKIWLMRFDTDRDGRISRNELRQAIRSVGGRFSWWKAKKGMEDVDLDSNGYVDSDEIDSLICFAQRNLGMKIATY